MGRPHWGNPRTREGELLSQGVSPKGLLLSPQVFHGGSVFPFLPYHPFPLPPGLYPISKGLKSSPSLHWDGPGELHCKGQSVASTGFPRPRARPLRGSSSSGDCGGIHYSSRHPPPQPVPGDCLLGSKLCFQIATICWPTSREMERDSFPS